MKTIAKNPIMPGFYPDPSICAVGEDYYLCNSGTYISLDDGDSNAWRYLHDEAESNTRVTFSADAFFFELYKLYKALSSEANCVRNYLTRIP